MKIFNTKLYVLEEMTQEDLNNLALDCVKKHNN